MPRLPRSTRHSPLRWLAIAGALCLAPAAQADGFYLDAQGKPIDICYSAQRNARLMYNAYANDAKDAFAEMKAFVFKELEGKGAPQSKLLAAYREVIAQIERGDFTPPKMERGPGNVAVRAAMGSACLKEFPLPDSPVKP